MVGEFQEQDLDLKAGPNRVPRRSGMGPFGSFWVLFGSARGPTGSGVSSDQNRFGKRGGCALRSEARSSLAQVLEEQGGG